MKPMYKYFISILFLFMFVDGFSQRPNNAERPKKEKNQQKEPLKEVKDTIVYKTSYGFRLGADISKPILSSIYTDYNGLELVGDYRVSKRIFIAAEIGYEEKTSDEDFTNSTAKGSYIRLGFNYNAYENWLDMNNEVFVGFRYGFSLFDQTLNNYTPNVSNPDNIINPADGNYFPSNFVDTATTTTNLNAHWTEFVVGFKVETIKNLFLSVSGSYKVLITTKDPQNFKTLYAPGFNRIFETNTGFGFNYTLSYLIPFKKK